MASPRGYTLVIAEKPRAAAKIAAALGLKSRSRLYGIPYWKGVFMGRKMIVAPAAGHLFSLRAKKYGYPVFEYEWVPRWEVEKGSSYLKKFFAALKKLSSGASEFINACDFDIEGSVIGFMIIKFFGDVRRARRVKFSSLTRDELRRAFMNIQPLDSLMVEAGLCRHELDWIWGINVSRALMDFYRQIIKKRIVLSAGRVQSPTLVEALRRQIERETFVPEISYNISVHVVINGKKYKVDNAFPPLKTKQAAFEAARRLRNIGKLIVTKKEKGIKQLRPLPPFNLPDLQLEASRVAGISPAETLRIAESLYLDSLISYPRTNSQKLPKGLDNRRIISSLSGLKYYRDYCSNLLLKSSLVPVQGKKDDPAHPAIYPTGYPPRKQLSRKEWVIYDLIVRRYLASFGDPAIIATVRYVLEGGSFRFVLTGQRLNRTGWLQIYKFVNVVDKEVPELEEGAEIEISSVRVTKQYSKPPPKYTKSTLLKWMESVGIGTEATRAEILEVLFRRGYLKSGKGGIEVTDLGLSVATILRNLFSEIISVELTRSFEGKLKLVSVGRESREKVVNEAQEVLKPKLEHVKQLVNESRTRNEDARILELAGKGIAGKKCVVCHRLGEYVRNGVLMCDLHAKAYDNIRKSYEIWKERSGISYEEYLSELAKLKSLGKYSREVVNYLLSLRT